MPTSEENNPIRNIKHGATAGMLPVFAAHQRSRTSGPHGDMSGSSRRKMTHVTHQRGSSWHTFVEQYERFTDMLCASAQYGVNEHREQEYLALRHWFTEHYYEHAHRIRPLLDSTHAIAQPIGHASAASSRTMDRFESIFLPRTLREVLMHDDGNLIHIVSQVSQAVYSVKPG
ncbi:MAG TPA: hypothetical protein VGK19_02850 [Capsulimonadaceae bacterium]|jgi:hypothetical protein